MQDHYETLGVRPGASSDEIEAAWRRAVNFWHPDRNKSREAAERLKEANLARKVLLDDAQRSRYDRSRVFEASNVAAAGASDRMDRPITHDMAPQGHARASAAGGRMNGPTAAPGGRRDRSREPTDFDDYDSNEPESGRRFMRTGPRPRRFSRKWWRHVTERALGEKVLDRGDQQVITLFDRRPKFVRFVLVPIGIAAIVLAALFTVLLV